MEIFGFQVPIWAIILLVVAVLVVAVGIPIYKGYKAELEKQAKREAAAKKKAAAKKR